MLGGGGSVFGVTTGGATSCKINDPWTVPDSCYHDEGKATAFALRPFPPPRPPPPLHTAYDVQVYACRYPILILTPSPLTICFRVILSPPSPNPPPPSATNNKKKTQVRRRQYLPRRVFRGPHPREGTADDMPRQYSRRGLRRRFRPRGQARPRHLRLPQGGRVGTSVYK